MTIFYVLLALLGIGVIIFLHELGHFLAAKKVGVRVERFLVGFDPPFRGKNLRFFTFKRGETEYALGMIPFGGYVKMAGETDLSSDKSGAPDELMSKSVGARALVFVAGAAMNIITAFFFFIIAFWVGVEFSVPEVGAVVQGTPAWEAGLRAGDRVVRVDGKKIIDFHELMVGVALGSGALDLTVDRDGEEHEVRVTPEWNSAAGFKTIGINPELSRTIADVEEGSPASQAGLREGDELVGIRLDGVELPHESMHQLVMMTDELRILRAQSGFDLRIRREGKEEWVHYVPQPASDATPNPQIGVVPGFGNTLRSVRSDEARQYFRPGERLVAIAGQPVQSITWIQVAEEVARSPGKDLELSFVSAFPPAAAAVTERRERVPGADFLRWQIDGDLYWSDYRCTVHELPSDSELAVAGLRAGDTIVEVADRPCFHPGELAELLGDGAGADVTITVWRSGEKRSLSVPRAALAAAEDALRWRTLRPLSATVDGGPAHAAGIEAGSLLRSIDGQEVVSWSEVTAAVTKRTPGESLSLSWVDSQGAEHSADLTVGMRPNAPFPSVEQLQELVTSPPLVAFTLGARRTVVVSKWVFLTLRSLFRREVSARNLQGPVGIAHVLTRVSQHGLGTLIYFMAMISVNLGLFNLLPFPILDGGHLLFLLVEKVKGSPVDIRIQEWATNIAFLLIISLAVFVTFNDLSRLFG